MRIHKIAIAAVVAAVIAQGQDRKTNAALFQMIRQGDDRGLAALLRGGIDPNMRDEAGATPLMHAAAFAPPSTIRLLTQAGSHVNATNDKGATALMWATYDAAKVRLLLDLGANVNAKTREGTNALISAALRGNIEVMRMLVAAGANVQDGTVFAPWKMDLANIAYTTNDAAMREFLEANRVQPPDVAAMTPPPITSWVLTNIFAWRPQPAPNNSALIKALLDRGANPNETVSQMTLAVPALARAVRVDDIETVRLFIDRGADVNAAGSRGLTPLMFAAAGNPNPVAVQLLLNKGARLDSRDQNGRTALDWALLQGETDVTYMLRKVGALEMAPRAVPPASVAKPRTTRAAIEMAIRHLQPASPVFYERGPKCISCHSQSLPSIAVKLAAEKGVTVDRELAKHPTAATLEQWERNRENLLLGNCSIFGFVGHVTYGMLGLAEEGVPANAATDAVSLCLKELQKADGHWVQGDIRPPLSSNSVIVYTALAIQALSKYAPPAWRNEVTARIARARNFLQNATPGDTQDESFKLLGLVWSPASAGEISSQTKRLRGLQREDGGWGQLPTMKSDAYATGQALYALHVSGMSPSAATYRKAAQYLLRTQLEDGTWYVRSRAIAFQPYFESGFPHGTNQFISSAATAWAVIALAYTL